MALFPVVINCMPKSGTHLISRLFSNLPAYRNSGFTLTAKTAMNRDDPASNYIVGISNPKRMEAREFESLIKKISGNHYVIGHIPYSDKTRDLFEKNNFKMIVLLRDPRDIACSFAYYFLANVEHPMNRYFMALPNMEACLESVIKGIEPSSEENKFCLKPLNDQMNSIMDWCQWKNVCTVFFELLIGEKGLGSVESQIQSVDIILKSLNLDMSKSDKDKILLQLYAEDSPTYRKGLVGDWKNHFTPAIDRLFILYCSDSLRRFNNLFDRSMIECKSTNDSA